MIHPLNHSLRPSKGFTLIEMLVVIAIIALLVGIIVPVVGRAKSSAMATQALSGIRQSGICLLTEAAENKGKIGIHIWGSSSGMRDYQLVGIVSKHLGATGKADLQLSKIIRTPAWYDPPFGSLSTWTAWGVNYENHPENGIEWVPTDIPGYPQRVHFLQIDLVKQPGRYALLGDSSDDRGQPHIRLSRINRGDRGFALRYNGKGPIFTLDGSARMIGRDQLETYAFETAYLFASGNPATNPELIQAN